MTSKIEFTNMHKWRKGLRQVRDSMTRGQLLKALRAGSNQAIAYTKVNIRNHHLIRTGNLINSVQETEAKEESPTKAFVTFGPQVVYATIHEFGGTIHATSGPFLVFQIKGQWYRKRSVVIPARPYLRPVFDVHENDLMNLIIANMKKQIADAWNTGA